MTDAQRTGLQLMTLAAPVLTYSGSTLRRRR